MIVEMFCFFSSPFVFQASVGLPIWLTLPKFCKPRTVFSEHTQTSEHCKVQRRLPLTSLFCPGKRVSIRNARTLSAERKRLNPPRDLIICRFAGDRRRGCPLSSPRDARFSRSCTATSKRNKILRFREASNCFQFA